MCRLFLNLSEYLDSEVEPRTCDQMRQHIDACPACVAFLRGLRAASTAAARWRFLAILR